MPFTLKRSNLGRITITGTDVKKSIGKPWQMFPAQTGKLPPGTNTILFLQLLDGKKVHSLSDDDDDDDDDDDNGGDSDDDDNDDDDDDADDDDDDNDDDDLLQGFAMSIQLSRVWRHVNHHHSTTPARLRLLPLRASRNTNNNINNINNTNNNKNKNPVLWSQKMKIPTHQTSISFLIVELHEEEVIRTKYSFAVFPRKTFQMKTNSSARLERQTTAGRSLYPSSVLSAT